VVKEYSISNKFTNSNNGCQHESHKDYRRWNGKDTSKHKEETYHSKNKWSYCKTQDTIPKQDRKISI
jgi:hypothetical protein